jgi:flagellar assembly factor FliW
MRVASDRFGEIEVEDGSPIRFPHGLIGFPDEKCFVLLRRRPGSPLGWLQSVASAGLAFPVVSAEALAYDYPDVPVAEAAARSGIGGSAESLAVLAVLCAPGGGMSATVNLLSPIVINADTRTGAQVFLESSRYSTQERLALRPAEVEHPPVQPPVHAPVEESLSAAAP